MISEIAGAIGGGLSGMVSHLTSGLSNAFSGIFLTAEGALTPIAEFSLTFLGISAAIGVCGLVFHIFNKGGKK